MGISGRVSCISYMKRLAYEIGNRVKEVPRWYTPRMAAASRAIAERIPLVDFVVEVRDARIPLSSECQVLTNYLHSPRRIVVLNKMDLANRSQLKDWIRYFEQRNFDSYAVNSHNKDNVKQFLNFLQACVRESKNMDHSACTKTMMIVGIPNVGKSALARSLHHIGRISAAEKGKLKHVKVSPHPGETEDITSLKIGSHPNIYVLDTPGIFPSRIIDEDICSKLALTGAFSDSLVLEKELARYFLAILNLSDEYKKWAKLSTHEKDRPFVEQKADSSMAKHLSDHTQDFVVQDARRRIYETISSANGEMQKEVDLEQLIELQFAALSETFNLPLVNDVRDKIAPKLLNLYRTGRLGHYTLDQLQV